MSGADMLNPLHNVLLHALDGEGTIEHTPAHTAAVRVLLETYDLDPATLNPDTIRSIMEEHDLHVEYAATHALEIAQGAQDVLEETKGSLTEAEEKAEELRGQVKALEHVHKELFEALYEGRNSAFDFEGMAAQEALAIAETDAAAAVEEIKLLQNNAQLTTVRNAPPPPPPRRKR